jgi:4-amino-4-deoxy-L-arabinose transferase-like glycosyltransferase
VRCDRTMLLLLGGYCAIWTAYGAIAKSSQDLHPDMAELIAWSRQLSFGYPKHPPLGAWLVRLWFGVFPVSDWSYYLLAMAMPALALWIVWRLSADYLDIDKRVVGVALLMLMPLYNFHALKFNANTILLPTWAATTLVFLRSYRGTSWRYGVLAGIGAALCMLAKYWSMVLFAGLLIAALVDSRRATYFRSAAPWITLAVAVALLSPHIIWIYQNDFVSLQYAEMAHVAGSFAQTAEKAFMYLAGAAAFAAAPVLFVLAAAGRGPASIETIWPTDRERRLIAAAFWGPLLVPILGALATGSILTPIWLMPAFTLLPILLLAPPTVKIPAVGRQALLAIVTAEPVVMLIAAPLVALAIHRAGVSPAAAHGRLLAAQTEQEWRQATTEPLRYVGCDMADEVIAYAEDRPLPLPWRSSGGRVADEVYADAHDWPRPPRRDGEPSDAEIAQRGMALVCSADRADWVGAAAKRSAADPASRRIEVELTRSFMGFAGQSHRYVIFILPPRR